MDFLDFKTGIDDAGRRLDKVIRIFVPEVSLSQIYKYLRKGLIKVNNIKSRPDYRINENDIIQIAQFILSETENNENADSTLSLDESLIVFENEHILILNKPAGINVHSAKKDEISLQTLVTNYYNKTRNNDSLSFKPGPLHRIDKYTQGLICFSMSTAGAQWFSKNMSEHNIKKSYIAIVEGTVTQSETWKDKLENLEETGTKFHTVKILDSEDDLPEDCDAKECISKIIPIETYKKGSFELTKARFDIETGRHHQIRAQSAYHGHPLYGDTAYGGHKTADNNGQFYLVAEKMIFPQNELGIPKEIHL